MRLLLAALILMMGTIPAGAQWLDRPTPGIPRTHDGKPDLTAPTPRGPDGKPDLTGIWNGPAPVPRADPINAQAWVNDVVRQHQQDYYKRRPFFRCLPSGPEAERFGGWKRILQTPATLAILNDNLTYRVIHMDGRALEADPAPSWMGYSVGRWEGDTLVVDTIGFNDKFWFDFRGHPHTEKLHTIERYTRKDRGTLVNEITIDDPGSYSKPFKVTFNARFMPGEELMEYICQENEQDTKHIQGPARTP